MMKSKSKDNAISQDFFLAYFYSLFRWTSKFCSSIIIPEAVENETNMGILV